MSGRWWLNTHPRWPLIITESSLHLETLLFRQALTDIRQGKTNCQARKVTNNRPWLLACTSNNLGLCDERQAESLSFTFSTGRAFPSTAWAWNERFSLTPFLPFFFFFCLHVSEVFVLVYEAYCCRKGIHFIATSFKNCSKIYTKDKKTYRASWLSFASASQSGSLSGWNKWRRPDCKAERWLMASVSETGLWISVHLSLPSLPVTRTPRVMLTVTRESSSFLKIEASADVTFPLLVLISDTSTSIFLPLGIAAGKQVQTDPSPHAKKWVRQCGSEFQDPAISPLPLPR